jgi:hypothetical protein
MPRIIIPTPIRLVKPSFYPLLMCITKWKGQLEPSYFSIRIMILIENQVFKKEKLQDLINTNLSKDSTTTFYLRLIKI